MQASSSKTQPQLLQGTEADGAQLPAASLSDANHNVEPPSTTCFLKDRINKWVEKSLSESVAPVENMEQLERRVLHYYSNSDIEKYLML